jgi:isochorismatase family protein
MPRNNIRRSQVAVLLIDVVNHFEFPGGKQTLRRALPIAPRLARLKQRAAKAHIPVIYVNDNFGKWHSDASKLVAYCLRPGCTGKPFVELIKPAEEDYCILKPMHARTRYSSLTVEYIRLLSGGVGVASPDSKRSHGTFHNTKATCGGLSALSKEAVEKKKSRCDLLYFIP